MGQEQLSIKLASRMHIEIDPGAWPEIGCAEWTYERNGGVVNARVVVRRHHDGRMAIYIRTDADEGPFINGNLIPVKTKEIEDAVSRFGEIHAQLGHCALHQISSRVEMTL